MTSTRCVHGIDNRFCAVCNRASRSAPRQAAVASGVTVADILRCLNDTRIRATYGAVASVLGIPAHSVGALLGERRPEASWVVNGDSGLPTDYEQADWHPALLESADVIRTGAELTLRLAVQRQRDAKG